MSQKVNAVPDPSFSVPPLTTVAGTRVSRRRIKVPCNFPGTKYSHNGQASLPNTCQFDIADNESFLDMDKSMIVLDFTPEFHSSAQVARRHPISNVGFNDSSQALMARVRIGNSQGLIIEELQAYGTWANIMESYSQSADQKENHLLDVSNCEDSQLISLKDHAGVAASQKRLRSHVTRRLFLRFKHSSFLKSCRMIPLFLMRNGIRFEIEFQNVLLALTKKVSAQWQGPYYAIPQLLSTIDGSPTDALDNRRYSDWYMYRSGNDVFIALRKSSALAVSLNLDERSVNNIHRVATYTSANAATVAAFYSTAPLAVPLKLEYTDSIGTDRVLWQGIGQISNELFRTSQNGLLVSVASTAAAVLAIQSNGISGNTSLADVGSLPAGNELYYQIQLRNVEDGFARVLINTSVTNETANIPYAFGRLRAYADPFDLQRLNLTDGQSASYIVSNDAGSAYNAAVAFAYDSTTQGQLHIANRDVSNTTWNYSCANIEMICDLVKPSSEVFLQFQQAFQAPAGIPYAYKRVLYYTKIINVADGIQQISLPYSVRSLRGLICVLSDKAAWSPTSDNTSKAFPALSAFMKRGMYRAQLVIGGQTYPNYDLNLTELGVEQIPELECLFNVAGLGSFNPSFDISELYSSHNYLAHVGQGSAGQLPYDGGMSLKDVVNTPGLSNFGLQEYHDTSKFVLGLSTMKKDGDFVTGVDTSQAGSISLNLYFKSEPDISNGYPGDSGSKLKRDVFVQVFGIADAVFTLQNDANLVRY